MSITAGRQVISDEEVRFFHENGFLVLRGVLQGEELRRVRGAMDELTRYGSEAVRDHPDFMYGEGHRTGRPVLRRVEYVIDKYEECRVLLGHPFILRSVEKLMGKDLIPTWDSMVLKLPGEGIIVPWHRDAGNCPAHLSLSAWRVLEEMTPSRASRQETSGLQRGIRLDVIWLQT